MCGLAHLHTQNIQVCKFANLQCSASSNVGILPELHGDNFTVCIEINSGNSCTVIKGMLVIESLTLCSILLKLQIKKLLQNMTP